MLREVARCPYCGRVSGRLNAAVPALVVPRGLSNGRPCRHLAFLSVGLEAFDEEGRGDDGRTRLWLWVAGEGVRELDRLDALNEYVDLLACRIPIVGEDPPEIEYRIAGMAAGEREADRPGSGHIQLVSSDGRALVGVFDGHALYSLHPDAFVAEVRRRAGEVPGGVREQK